MFYDLALPALGTDSNAAASSSAVDAAAASISDAASRSLDRLLTAASLGYSVVAIEREVYGRLNAAEEAGPPPGSVVSREALAAAAAGAGAGAFAAPVGRIPRRSALRISAAEPHGGGGGGGGGSVVGVPLARQQQQQRQQQALPPPRMTQLTRLTLATGDPGEAAAVLGNRIGKAGGGGAGVAVAAATVARSSAGDNGGGSGNAAAAGGGAPPPPPQTFSSSSSIIIPPTARRSYDILAIRPLNSRVLAQAATSLDVDVIVLDFAGSGGGGGGGGSGGGKRPPQQQPSPSSSSFSFSLARMPKPAALRPALARGISLEIRYAPALSSEAERRALLAGLGSLSTTLRGRGGGGGGGGTKKPNAECLSPFLLSSGATGSSSLRAPLDAAALAEVGGMTRAAALAAVTRVPAQVAARARRRRAASRGECGFVGGREAMSEMAGMEEERRKMKRKAGSGVHFNQARQQKQGGGGGGVAKKNKKK